MRLRARRKDVLPLLAGPMIPKISWRWIVEGDVAQGAPAAVRDGEVADLDYGRLVVRRAGTAVGDGCIYHFFSPLR